MSKKANKTVIGAFVVGAIALLTAGVLIFGSGKLLSKSDSYILYFQGSVKGLNIGSPVMFRGVKIGSVTDISLKYDPVDLSMFIPVIIDIKQGRFQPTTGEKRSKRRSIKELIDKGLKAKLMLQSMVTGQLIIDLNFVEDEPVNLTGLDSKIPELPTIPSDMEKLSRTLENIPFEKIFNELSSAIEGLQNILNSPAMIGSIEAAEKTLEAIQKLTNDLDSQIKPLFSNIESTSNAARSALAQVEKTFAMKEGVPGELASGIKDTLVSVNDTMKRADRTLASLQGVAGEDSATVYELNKTLEELTAAARSVRFLSDYLERHPEALLRGKGSPKGE
jgi:paraquat-inducible protein B